MKKQIYILSLYQPQACINSVEKYISIVPVKNQMKKRLSQTLGNVNLSDYWIAQGDEICNRDFSYICQYICLLSDDDAEDWKKDLYGKYVCLQFLKIDVDDKRLRHRTDGFIKEVKNKLLRISNWNGKYFRTIDNADLVLIFGADSHDKLMECANQIKNELENDLFSFYSIQGFCQKENDGLRIINCTTEQEGGCKKHILFKNGWCNAAIKELIKQLKEYESEKNKKMSAYYRTLIQTVGILEQYEQEVILKDIFFIFYPSISLFLKQLTQGQNEIYKLEKKIEKSVDEREKAELEKEKYGRIAKVERALSQFIDSIEVLMHHMGHSCPDILGENGRGGMPFDIPIRLCLMYISFMHLLSSVLDDKGYSYRYCLEPLTYSRPITNCIDFGLPPHDRLIRVKVSKHTMFTPRSFLIILSHEVSHYANCDSRNRELRSKQFLIIASITLVNLLTEELNEVVQGGYLEEDIWNDYIKQVRNRLYTYIYQRMTTNYKAVKAKAENKERVDHFSELWEVEKKICGKILYDADGRLENEIDYLGKVLMDKICKKVSDGMLYQSLQQVFNLQQAIKARIQQQLFTQTYMKFLLLMENVLREIYADISAILVLQLTPDAYLEAYLISESYIPNVDDFEENVINRFAVVNKVMQEKNQKWKEQWEKIGEGPSSQLNVRGDYNDKQADNRFLIELKRKIEEYSEEIFSEEARSTVLGGKQCAEGSLFYCKEIVSLERYYLLECYKTLSTYLKGKSKDQQNRLKALQNLYQCFGVYKAGEDISFEEFFGRCDEILYYYKTDVSEVREREGQQGPNCL